MKVTRSYWLGLGSGLILSAKLTSIIPPHQGQAVTPQEPSPVHPVQQKATLPLSEGTKRTDPSPAVQPSQGETSNSQFERNFVIPEGASSERIADLLVTQGLIKDKAKFLEVAHKMGVESKFRAGTFSLSLGLTIEELINRLLKI